MTTWRLSRTCRAHRSPRSISPYVTNVSTDSAGRYTTPALAPGVYTLEFSNWGGLYIEEWWDGATSREAATPLTVGTGPVTGVNASMRLGGVITGYVHDEDYQPVQGATVGLATPPASGVEAFFAPLFALFGVSSPLLGVETTTDANGECTLPAVDSGDYALYVYTPEHGTIWSGASRTLAGSSPVHVASGERTWENVQLPRLADGEEPRTPAQSISDDFAIQQDPQDTSVVEGETAIFTAAASGATVPGIQWQIKQPGDADFRDLADETWEELSLQGLTLADTGTQVRAVFTLGGETKTTTAATLTVTPAPTAPDKPAAPTVSAITAGSATVSWTAPGDGGSLISGYTVTVRDGSTLVKTYELAPTGTVLVSGLSAATAYTVTVVAHNGIGSSVASDETAFTTPAAAVVPGAPTGVSAVAGDGQATVSWAAPASNGGSPLTGFVVTAAPGGATVTAGAGATSAVVPGLTNGTAYTFTVVATNAVGSSAASAASAAVTPVAPTVPEERSTRWIRGSRRRDSRGRGGTTRPRRSRRRRSRRECRSSTSPRD